PLVRVATAECCSHRAVAAIPSNGAIYVESIRADRRSPLDRPLRRRHQRHGGLGRLGGERHRPHAPAAHRPHHRSAQEKHQDHLLSLVGRRLQPEMYPPAKALGEDLPRCGFYIAPEDIDHHLRRLDRHKIPHSDPIHTAADGEEGTLIYFADPDGNQYELWAPADMPKGAMEIATAERVGRISHGVYGSRDLARTAAFFEKYCGMRAEHNSRTAEGTLVLRLQAGPRLVYKRVGKVDERVSGHGTWWDMHTALTVRAEEFLPNYRRLWEGIPEEAGYKADLNLTLAEQEALPARTGLHRSPVGIK